MGVTAINTSVIIIGAGPAGAGVSFFLSKYNIPHVVLEKDVFPRDKICGDACSGKTALVLKRANPEWWEEIVAQGTTYLPAWGITFTAPNLRPLDIPFYLKKDSSLPPPGFVVPRLVFDNFLFSKMESPYCAVFQNAAIEQITQEASPDAATEQGRPVTVTFRHEGKSMCVAAPVIVGADGDKGIVRKTFLNLPANPRAYAVGLRAYYENVTGLHAENFLELHFLKELLPGYFWIFPMPNGKVNVGLGILSSVVRQKKINLRQTMTDIISNHPAIAPRFNNATALDKISGWGLPLASGSPPVSGSNFILTGDAACLVDPFSGEGIGNALYSGMLAAAAIRDALESGNFSRAFFAEQYDKVVYRRLGTEFRISTGLQQLCRYPLLFNLVVNKAIKSAALRDTISSMFTNLDLRDQLRKPSFYFKILMNR
jgi:menaquinone-9 beta-reductase